MITTGVRDFQEVLETLNIFDLRFSGHLFTWWDCNHSDPVLKKLDRVLVNEAWISIFPMSRTHFLPRGLSDHNPAVTFLGLNQETLKKPFQIFQFLLEHPDFLRTVEEAWCFTVLGDPWYILSMKLKRVKDALKRLNRNFGN